MNGSNNSILNRIFTKNTFTELINKNMNTTYCSIIRRYLNDVEYKENQVLISEIYKIMTKAYRNEYFYKNTLLNKLLIGKHSLKTTTALTEIPINKSKADFVLINGKAVVYEIKTELDTLERLESQLNDYFKAFDHVCVVTCESNYTKVSNLLSDSKVGIYILTNRNQLSVRKEPIKDCSKLDYTIMFKILRKQEFENIIIEHYNRLPITTQINYYDECCKLFKEIDLETAYKAFIKQLKKRNKIEIEEYIKYVPYELRFLIYFSKFKMNDYIRLDGFLKNEFGG